jgi:hypothetical protein
MQLDAQGNRDQPLRVNDWGTNGVWIVTLVIALCGLLALWGAVQGDSSEALPLGVALLLFSLLCGRVAMLGVVLEDDGIKVRTWFRTYRLKWAEIEDFELRGTVFRTSLHVRLVDGRVIGAQGLAARTDSERQRAQEIFADLKRRLLEQH